MTFRFASWTLHLTKPACPGTSKSARREAPPANYAQVGATIAVEMKVALARLAAVLPLSRNAWCQLAGPLGPDVYVGSPEPRHVWVTLAEAKDGFVKRGSGHCRVDVLRVAFGQL